MKYPIVSARRQAGVGLIEVLISVLILALGLLGIAALQATALKNSNGSMAQSQAVISAYSMMDMMRANREAAIIGSYDLDDWVCAPPATGSRIGNDQHQWIQGLQDSVGEGSCGKISCTPLSCKVSVKWDNSRSTGGSDQQEYQLETQL